MGGASARGADPAGKDLPPVWPDPVGGAKGLTLTPLHKSASEVALADPWMHEALALVDAMRAGDARDQEDRPRSLLRARLPTSSGEPRNCSAPARSSSDAPSTPAMCRSSACWKRPSNIA